MNLKVKEIHQIKQNRPRLRNKEVIRDNILTRIEQEESVQIASKYFWLRIAASIVIVLTISSYGWFEFDTHNQRSLTLASLHDSYIPVKADIECQFTIKSLVAMLDQVGLEHVFDKNIVRLTQTDLDYLKSINSSLVVDVEGFLKAVEKLYPMQYQSFLYGEGVQLSVWQLKNDQRICQWFNN